MNWIKVSINLFISIIRLKLLARYPIQMGAMGGGGANAVQYGCTQYCDHSDVSQCQFLCIYEACVMKPTLIKFR